MNLFYQQVYDIVAQVPPGKVVSYGQIARMLGRPRAAREWGSPTSRRGSRRCSARRRR